jgi:hypothetical protein
MKTERNEVAEQGVRSRYGRSVVVQQGRELDCNGFTITTECRITSKFGKPYILVEYLVNNLTNYVNVIIDKDIIQFDKYIDAEKYVMEQIGGEK